MIILNNLGGFKRGRVWINEMPDIRGNVIDIVESSVDVISQQQWEEKVIAIELLLAPRDISSYALLGAKYTPSNTEKLIIKVNVSKSNDDILMDNIALSTDEVHKGIPTDYALSVINMAQEKALELNYPAGSLVFDIGAHGYVGSSKVAFLTVTKVLMGLLGKDIVGKSTEDLNDIVSQLLKA